jgi:hypothetical protein
VGTQLARPQLDLIVEQQQLDQTRALEHRLAPETADEQLGLKWCLLVFFGSDFENRFATVGGVPSKVQNEDYFARMGAANDSRPDHLPPSQGGKYGGFGSGGPGPAARGGGGGGGSANPLSSRNLPGIDDLRDDPMGALNKGWGFLGAALGAVGKTVNE